MRSVFVAVGIESATKVLIVTQLGEPMIYWEYILLLHYWMGKGTKWGHDMCMLKYSELVTFLYFVELDSCGQYG